MASKSSFIFSFLLLLASAFLLLSLENCANRGTLTGGPKDSLAPFVRRSIPANQGLNHRNNLIIIEFSEWVREKSLFKELLITPIVKSFTFKIINNRLELTIQDTLKENTTYNLNFRNGIEDITESNKAVIDTISRKPLRIAFSTGASIDTMAVSGNVVQLLSNQPVKEAIVSLYQAEDTLQINEDKPYYFTLTDEKGNFRIENVRAGKYKIYALAEKDGNLLYQEPEYIGFVEKGIFLGDTIKEVSTALKMVIEDHSAPKLEKNRPLDNTYLLEFNEGLREIKVETDNQAITAYNLDEKGKTAILYNTKAIFDSLDVRITAIDSLGNTLQDTTKIAFKKEDEKDKNRRERRENNEKKGGKPVLEFEMKLKSGEAIEKDLELDFIFPKPVENVDFSKINYYRDKDTLNVKPLLHGDSTKEYRWNVFHNILSVKKKINLTQSINLKIDSIAFVSVDKQVSNPTKKSFNLKNPGSFGTISGKVITKEPNYILQLLTDRFDIVGERLNPKNFDFAFLPAGTYQIRIIVDSNANGRWDSSDVLKSIPPETIHFRVLPNNGKLRERWDIQGAIVEF